MEHEIGNFQVLLQVFKQQIQSKICHRNSTKSMSKMLIVNSTCSIYSYQPMLMKNT